MKSWFVVVQSFWRIAKRCDNQSIRGLNSFSFPITDSKVKETSKLGPRPEKPIEIYEFERYIFHTSILCGTIFLFSLNLILTIIKLTPMYLFLVFSSLHVQITTDNSQLPILPEGNFFFFEQCPNELYLFRKIFHITP